jgi:hypothetical protein
MGAYTIRAAYPSQERVLFEFTLPEERDEWFGMIEFTLPEEDLSGYLSELAYDLFQYRPGELAEDTPNRTVIAAALGRRWIQWPGLSTLPTGALVTITTPAGESYQRICDLVGWIDPTEPAQPEEED